MATIDTTPISLNIKHNNKIFTIVLINLNDKVVLNIADSNGQSISLNKQYSVKKNDLYDMSPWTQVISLNNLRPIDELVRIIESDLKKGLLP